MHLRLERSSRAIALIAASLTIAACGAGGGGDDGGKKAAGEPRAKSDVKSLEIVTAPTGSVFFPLGAALASRLEAKLDIPVTASPSAGSGENVTLLSNGTAQLGIVASNALVPAYAGETPYDKRHETLRPISHLYPNALLVYTLAKSKLTKVSDLEGKRVGVGIEARTWDHFIRPLFQSQGLTYGDNITPVYAGFDDMARQVRDGQLDAAIATGGANAPSPAYQELASDLDVRVLEWDKPALDKVFEEIKYMKPFPYPSDLLLGGHPGGGEYYTADIGGPYLATSSTLPEDLVYDITKIFHEELDAMAKDVGVLKWVTEQDDKNLVQPLGDLPFHDGATKYWREIGAMT